MHQRTDSKCFLSPPSLFSIPILRNVSGDKVISASPSLGLCFMCNGIPGPDGSGQATLTRLSPMAPARPRIVTPDLYCTRVQCVQWTWCVLYSLRLTAVVNGCRILTLRGCRSQSVAASRSRPQLWLARLSLSRALASAGRDLTEATSSVLHHQPLVTAVSSDSSEARSYPSVTWSWWHTPCLLARAWRRPERAGMAGGQAYYGHKYKSRYVDIQRLRQAAEAGPGPGILHWPWSSEARAQPQLISEVSRAGQGRVGGQGQHSTPWASQYHNNYHTDTRGAQQANSMLSKISCISSKNAS